MYAAIIFSFALLSSWWAINWTVVYAIYKNIEYRHVIADKPLKSKIDTSSAYTIDILAVFFWGWYYYLTH